MPHTIKDGQYFPMACPGCKEVAGMPFLAGTEVESSSIKVGMRCRDCGHEWRYDMPITTQRKRDSAVNVVVEPD